MIFVVLSVLCLLPSQAWAFSVVDNQYFKAPLTDHSIYYLGQLFGTVGNVLHGNNFLLSIIFARLNTAMWLFAGMIASYFTVKSVIKTAMEGKILGEQGNYWLAARVITGVLALLPKFNGYSFVQVVVMWVVVQSIGLADQTWNAALDYFSAGGTFYSSGLPAAGGKVDTAAEAKLFQETLTDSASMLNAAVCMYSLQKQAMDTHKQRGLPPPSFPSPFADPNLIQWGNNDYPTACGFHTLNNATPDGAKVIKTAAMIQATMDTMALAKHIVDETRITDGNLVTSCTDCKESDALASIAREYANNIKLAWPLPAESNAQTAFNRRMDKARAEGWIMAGAYYNDLINASSSTTTNGWVGHPYRFPLENNPGLVFNGIGAADTVPQWQALTTPVKDTYSVLLLNPNPNVKQYFVNVRAYYTQAANKRMTPSAQSQLRDKTQNAMDNQIFHHGPENQYLVAAGTVGFSQFLEMFGVHIGWNKPVTAFNVIDEDVKHLINGAIKAWDKAVLPTGATGQDAYIDPLTRARQLGQGLISTALTFWQDVTQHTFNILTVSAATMSGAMALLAVALAYAGMPGGQSIIGRDISTVFNTGMQMGFQIMTSRVFWYLPLGAAISTPMFIIGASLGAYLPLIPFIVFTFAVIGWFISVLEAMVAAPLVAFGMTHPEGHDVLGKTEQGLMLLLALFIRPVCMIIGLLIGIVLIFLGTELFDMGYLDLILNLLKDSQQVLNKLMGVDGAFTVLVIMMIFLVIYTFILIAIVNQCMTAIYVLPDKIMRWIGVPPESSTVSAMVEQTKSGTEGKMGEGAQAGAGMGGEIRHSGIQPQATQHKAKDQGGATLNT